MGKIKTVIKKIIFIPHNIYNKLLFKLYRTECGRDVKIIGKIGMYRGGRLHIGDNVVINSCRYANPLGDKMIFEIKRGADVFIGNNSGLSGTIIKAHACVRIGEYVNVGAGCIIMDTDAHALSACDRMSPVDNEDQTVSKPIHIKNGVFIGTRSIILKGVTIGEGSVVGAGSVVTKSIPAGEVWAGNPAKFIRKIL